MSSHYETLTRAADMVATRLGRAQVGVVLGSGLSEALDGLDRPQYLDYAEIPGMPSPKTPGHTGALLRGECGGASVLALCGRTHVYEDRPYHEVAFGVRLLSLLGVHTLLVTSAVGSADRQCGPGTIVLVEDHINLSGANVLAGDEEPRLGPRFPDLSQAYDPAVIALLEDTGRQAGIRTSRGILACFRGPTYETPAEVRMAKLLGAKVMSMSMVPEVLVARQRGMRVGGLGSVTNLAAGVSPTPLSHEEVLRGSAANVVQLQGLLCGAIPRLVHAELGAG